jgi:hypothetical protein
MDEMWMRERCRGSMTWQTNMSRAQPKLESGERETKIRVVRAGDQILVKTKPTY